MPSISSLPGELHTLILQLLPTSDALQVRLLNHHFHQLATQFVFSKITVDLSRINEILDVVAVYAGVSDSRFPARDILVYWPCWRSGDEKHFTLCLGAIAVLLPHMLELAKAHLYLPCRGDVINENHLEIIRRLIQLPSLFHLQIVGKLPLLPRLFSGSNLRVVKIKHFNLLYGHEGGLECILMLLNACHHLHRLEIQLSKPTVNEQPLHQFVDHHLIHEARYVEMTSLCLTLLNSRQDVPGVMDLVHFCTFLMPQLDFLCLAISSHFSKGIARRAQVFSDAADSMPRSVITHYPRVAFRIGLRHDLLDDFLAELPRSLAFSLDLSLHYGWLPMTMLSDMTSLTELGIIQAVVYSMHDIFTALPAAVCLKRLSLCHCQIDSPVTLQHVILMLPSLSSLSLNFVTFTTQPRRPQAAIENRWISVLCDFFKSDQARTDDASLIWFALPTSTALRVSAFEEYSFDDSDERVCILLQDEQSSIGKNVRIWYCRRNYYDRVDEQFELDDDETTAVLSALEHALGMEPQDADEHVLPNILGALP
ncbi:hypothetical protein BC940DRAFT_356000 [Gongronella butleri]|nr:hypothetical protein BC940DRAFT_356000 [Gongronella butleri]